jgi:hypothetical protein
MTNRGKAYPSDRSDSARKAVHTSVTMPAIMNCCLPVAWTAARNSALSHALCAYISIFLKRFEEEIAHLTSPPLLIYGALGNISTNSLSTGPFGPVSADDVITTGRLKSLPIVAWAFMFCLNSVASQSRASWKRPTWWSTMRSAYNDMIRWLRRHKMGV